MDLLRHFEQEQIKNTQRPKLQAGDIVRVATKIEEENKTRLQTFEGTILMLRGSGPSTTFTVRRETSGFGVERIFALYSPLITNIEVIKRQRVRRAKLTYLRQAGRRRFKEDVKAMQRLIKEEKQQQRQAEEATRRLAAAKERQQKDTAKEKETKETQPLEPNQSPSADQAPDPKK